APPPLRCNRDGASAWQARFRSGAIVTELRRGKPSVITRAVFFDVDFTLIHPGPAFQGQGFPEACARHGVRVDPSRFAAAVASASLTLHDEGGPYDPGVFITFTSRIIEG